MRKTEETQEIFYPILDRQGSIIAILNSDNEFVESRSYDAWGKLRNPLDWTNKDVSNLSVTNRGYTFHEHLLDAGLINMNGRLYDPAIARMLSPDNYVQNRANPQNFNRYSYVLNNPMKYTDPSGELIFFIPSIGWSNQGGVDISATVGVGVPGVLSAQTTLGHSFGSRNSYVSVSGSLGGLTASVGYGTQTGVTAGLNYGLPGLSHGFGTNLTSSGINWSENGGFSANAFGLNYGQDGFGFNPSLSYSHTFIFDKKMPAVPAPPSQELLANLDDELGLIMGSEGEKNVVGGDWDFWGEGYVDYKGTQLGGTNFISCPTCPESPNSDPYRLKDPNNPGKYLAPVDQIDKAAQAHDAAYVNAGTGGIKGAFFNQKVKYHDALLTMRAYQIMKQYRNGDPSISPRTYNLSRAVYYTFAPIVYHKIRY